MENSKIEWTDHTFNPWIGCTKVHQGCANCYAEELMDLRYGKVKWGDSGARVVTSDSNWREPRKWNKAAESTGKRARVFCASLADVFEDRESIFSAREKLFNLIVMTPHLDWLILTKRPENIERLLPWYKTDAGQSRIYRNVWFGTSISLQSHACKQIPHLLAAKHWCSGTFLSIEPLLGEINLYDDPSWFWSSNIKWVIVGGESGKNARPMEAEWVRILREQCVQAGIPFFFKQWGEFVPRIAGINESAGWDGMKMVRVGKKEAGAMLDGREWKQTPFTTDANQC